MQSKACQQDGRLQLCWVLLGLIALLSGNCTTASLALVVFAIIRSFMQVATLVKADWLFLLTDVDSLYTANPATNPGATPIPEVHDITKLQVSQCSSSQ